MGVLQVPIVQNFKYFQSTGLWAIAIAGVRPFELPLTIKFPVLTLYHLGHLVSPWPLNIQLSASPLPCWLITRFFNQNWQRMFRMPFVLPVDGSWSPWSIITGYFLLNRSLSISISLDLLGPCSLECGGGDQRTYRSCTDPAPRVRATRVWDKLGLMNVFAVELLKYIRNMPLN